VLLIDVGKLRELVSIAFVEAVGVEAGAARGDSKDRETAFPGPGLDALAEPHANLAVAVAVFDNESTDQCVWG